MGSIPIARSNSLKELRQRNSEPESHASAECPRNPFAGRSDQDPLLTPDPREESGDCTPVSSGDQTAPKIGVRERCATPAAHRGYQDHFEGLAHPSVRLVAQLNERWRVVDDTRNGYCSERRAIPGKRILAGETVLSAPRVKCCCAAFASVSPKSTRMLSLSFGDYPKITQTTDIDHESQSVLAEE